MAFQLSLCVTYFLMLSLISSSLARVDYVGFNFKCQSYVPVKPPPSSTCSRGLDRFPDEFEECRGEGNKTCYFFIDEPPFTSIDIGNGDLESIELQRPFKCRDFKTAFGDKARFTGISFEIHKKTISGDDLCIYTGPSCEFNHLVDFTQVMASEGYRFASSGYLLETPARHCLHHASVPIADDTVVIIGEREKKSSPAIRIFEPFHWGSWLIFVFTFISFLIVCFFISWKLHANKTRFIGDGLQLLLGRERSTQLKDEIPATQEGGLSRSIAARDSIVGALLRMSVGSSILIFILFYEVAVVNVLFSERTPTLSKQISRLTLDELKQYGILQNSALENVWISVVSTSRLKFKVSDPSSYPWRSCATIAECNELLRNGEIKFLVSFEIEARYFLSDNSMCNKFAVYETKDALYKFNGGWLYNSAVNTERRKEVDRQLLVLRINGELEELFAKILGREKCKVKPNNTITPGTIIIPVLGLIFPSLISALLVLFFWEKIDSHFSVSKVTDDSSDAESVSDEFSKSTELRIQIEP